MSILNISPLTNRRCKDDHDNGYEDDHGVIWMDICNTLHVYYKNDPKEFLQEQNWDVVRIIESLQKTKKHLFPYLGGIKLSSYWLLILSYFTSAKLKNTHEISIIPDTHIIKSTIRLGLAADTVTPLETETIWRAVLKEHGIPPTEMHSTLWRWSWGGFSQEI